MLLPKHNKPGRKTGSSCKAAHPLPLLSASICLLESGEDKIPIKRFQKSPGTDYSQAFRESRE